MRDLLKSFYRSFYVREVSYGTEEISEIKTTEFEAMLSAYSGGKGVDNYLKERLLELQGTDPNTWIIQLWKQFNNVREYAQPYPFEASSEMALDFAYEVGDLQYLTIRTWLPNPENPGKPFQQLTCFQKGLSSTLTQIGKQAFGTDLIEVKEDVILLPGLEYNIAGSMWLYQEYNNGLAEIKAFRAGYQRDLQTDGETFVWPWVASEPSLNHSLKITAELQFTAATAAFPILIRMGESCPEPEQDGLGGCGGTGKVNGYTCKTCGGTGNKKMSTSSAEEVVFRMPIENLSPEDIKNLPDLSKLMYYVTPDVSILQWMETHYEKVRAQAWKDFTGNDTMERPNATQTDTATAKMLDRQKENNPVYEFGVFYSVVWKFIVYAVADITGKAQGLQAQIFVGKDLKLKTIGELMEELEKAITSGAGAAVIRSIQYDMMRIVTLDNPQDFIEYQIQDRFDPFAGCTPEEKIVKSQDPLVPLAKRTLFANLGWIFDEIEQENPGFYKMPYEMQRQIVNLKVAEIIEGNAAQREAEAPEIELTNQPFEAQNVN